MNSKICGDCPNPKILIVTFLITIEKMWNLKNIVTTLNITSQTIRRYLELFQTTHIRKRKHSTHLIWKQ